MRPVVTAGRDVDTQGRGRLLLSTVTVALALGALTALGQQYLPDQLRSLAKGAGSWSLAAFLLALRARRPGSAAACAALALVGLVAGYYATNELRGYPASLTYVAFWTSAAVLVGPVLGLAASWLRAAARRLRV